MPTPLTTTLLHRRDCPQCEATAPKFGAHTLLCRWRQLRQQAGQAWSAGTARFADCVIDRPALFCLLSVIVWYLISQVAFTNLDTYGDMIEAYVFTPNWELGTFKHPPLTGWVAKAWFAFMPHTVWAFYLLSCIGVLIGMLGALRLADEFIPRDRRTLVLMALSLTMPFSTLAYKFNANSILLPIWPWLALMFVRSLRGRHWGYALGLGILSALGMLGKYYTGVLLVSMLIAALATHSGRRWLMTPAPWLALAVFALCLLPHALWELRHGESTVQYVGRKADHHVDWKHLFSFLLSPIGYCGLAWLLLLACGFRGSLLERARASYRRHTDGDDVLFWLTLSPLAITALFALSGYVKIALHWSIPLAYLFPLFWLTRATDWQPARARELLRALPAVWLGLLLLAAAFNAGQAFSGKACHYRDDADAARAILAARPGKPPAWVGGSWPEVAIVPFFADTSVRVVPGVPDRLPAGVTPVANWRGQAGALLCRPDDLSCQRQATDWLRQQGRSGQAVDIRVVRQGWMYPLAVPTHYLVYWY
ncbi:glycosyltransferase family 39 protein [Paludibacterium purpuratum]|uniref:Dolichyl-phosphate-mannose-protein mannosyltransferase n=1 Tax=Paludibacterium purpuratum TaxID=1144873 RepID=A0A4R7B8P4_9NEIS|nr:glycosyltransferase family 39 protein [Paludibacterium purpuratum]TDR79967.1 dolichyl-phosphate-mannose-protein mannosyltransferase [Paludibacterium purpuratum]